MWVWGGAVLGVVLLSQSSAAKKLIPAPGGSGSGFTRSRLADAAREEMAWWAGRLETNPDVRKRLLEYWLVATNGNRAQAEGLLNSRAHWSAAYISYCAKKAGAGKLFAYSTAHWVYLAAAKKNREAKNSNPFKLYRLNEYKPQVGDIVAATRDGSRLNYDNIEDGGPAHCDIVIGVTATSISVVGGNWDDTVKRHNIRLVDGFVDPLQWGNFAIMRCGK